MIPRRHSCRKIRQNVCPRELQLANQGKFAHLKSYDYACVILRTSYRYVYHIFISYFLTRIQEFVNTHHRNINRGRRPSMVLHCEMWINFRIRISVINNHPHTRKFNWKCGNRVGIVVYNLLPLCWRRSHEKRQIISSIGGKSSISLRSRFSLSRNRRKYVTLNI